MEASSFVELVLQAVFGPKKEKNILDLVHEKEESNVSRKDLVAN